MCTYRYLAPVANNQYNSGMERIQIEDWGEIPYEEALQAMRDYVTARLNNEREDTLILCSHPPVFTLGRKLGAAQNLVSVKDIPVIEVERGGDVTYHGPGQQVLYPILQLQEGERDLHKYLRALEESAIQTLAAFGLTGDRSGPTGVWVGGRKIASLGIAARRWVVFHGVALNVSVDLSPFFGINPCGLDPNVMTTIEGELGHPVDARQIRDIFVQEALRALHRSVTL
jgi:lipoyl(octanoyl) transferase